MKELLHLVPKGLRAKAAGKDGAALPLADFGGMSGRVVLLRELDLSECEDAERAASKQMDENSNGLDYDKLRTRERLIRAIVGVSDPHVAPAAARTVNLKPVTAGDLEGVTMKPGADGKGKSTGLSYAELFTWKDTRVLQAWDKKRHAVPQEDVDDILGNSIPTMD